MATFNTLSTHVLDTALGKPAAGVNITLLQMGTGEIMATAITNDDGRVSEWSTPLHLLAGDFTLQFAVSDYFAGSGRTCFYPAVTIHFRLGEEGQHYHVPLVISPFSYSTYRGS